MNKKLAWGLTLGLALGTVAAIAGAAAVKKIKKEIQSDTEYDSFYSPLKDRLVIVSYGSSKTACGLTRIKIEASARGKEDICRLITFTKKSDEPFCGEWIDNDHFRLLIGNGKRRQCCDVSFDGDKIVSKYYLIKV